MSVCRKGHGVDIRTAPDAQERIGRQFGGEFEMSQPFRGHPQGEGRAADREMRRPAQLGTRVGQRQRAVGPLITVGDPPLDEPRCPERDHAGDRGAGAAQRLGEGDRAFEGSLQMLGRVAVPGVQRRRHRLQNRKFPGVPVPPGRHGRDDRQRLLVQPDGLGVAEPGRRDLGRSLVVGQRPRGPPAAGVLLRELGRDRVGVLGVEQLEALGDPAMQEPAFRRADRRVCRVAQQVVGEVVAVPELVHDPAPPQLVDRLHDGVGLQVTGLGEQVKGEVRADRGREPGHFPGRPGCLFEAFAQHGGQIAARQRRAARLVGATHCLDDVEREAARCRVQQVGVRCTQRPPGNGPGEMRRAAGVQRGEEKLGQQSGGPHPDQPAHQLRVGIEAVVAQRGGNEQRGTVGQAEAERDERQRLLVAPLHVVQDQQGRPADREQRPRDAFEEPVALPGIGHGPVSGFTSRAALGRQQPADLGAPGGVEGGHRRLDGGGSQPVRHRGQRQPPRCPEALAARHHRALQHGPPGHLGHQAGLPDTRTAADHRQAPAADRSGPPQVVQLVKLPGPADELRRGRPGAAGRGLGRGRLFAR